jgi:hypothetical protein
VAEFSFAYVTKGVLLGEMFGSICYVPDLSCSVHMAGAHSTRP